MANLTSIGTILLNDPTFVKNLNKALVQTNANFQRLGTIGLFSGEDGQDASFMKYNLDAIFLPIFIETLSDDNTLGWNKDICGDTKNTKIYNQLFKKFGNNIASIMPMPADASKDITTRYDQAYKDMTEWCKIHGKPSEYIDKCQEIIEALYAAIRNKYNTSNVLDDVIYNDAEKTSDASKDTITRYDHADNDVIKVRKAYVSPSNIDKYHTTVDALDDFTINGKYNVLNDAIYNDTINSSIAYKTLWVDSWYNAVKIDDCDNIYRTHIKDYPLGIIQVIENESGVIIGSLPYSFIDPRFNNAHVAQIADELKSKINATSLITLHQENDTLIGKILDIIPKIYCDPIDGKWKWSINGENTGIPAQGVDGKAGQNGSILILQRLENGITISKGTKDVFIPIIPDSYEGTVEPTDESVKSITFKWLDPLVDDNAMVNRIVHTATITDDGRIVKETPNSAAAANDPKIKTLVDYMTSYSDAFIDKSKIPAETVRAIRYALWDNVNRTNKYDTNYTGRFRIWKRLTDDSCLYVAGDKGGTFNGNATDAYSPTAGYKYGYKVKEGTTDPGQAEITNMDGQACIVFPGAPYDVGETRSSFWFGTVHIQRAYPKDKDATCNIATVICDETNMIRCDLDQNTFAGDMMRLDPYITEEPDRYGGAHHYPRGLMLPIGSPLMTNDSLSALSKDFSSHILYSDQGGFDTLTERPGSIWRGVFDGIGAWQTLNDIQGYKKSDKNILHIGSVQDYRGLDYVSTDNIAVPGRIEGSANNNQITPDNENVDVRSDHNFQSRVNIDEPTVLTSYRDTKYPDYADTYADTKYPEYPALLTAEGDVVIGAYKHVNNIKYFWAADDNGNTPDYAATNPDPQNNPTGDYANPNPDSHRTEDVVNIADKGGRGTLGQGGLWIQGSITKALADRMRMSFFEKSPMRSVIGTTFDIIPMGIGFLDVKNADGNYIRIMTPDPDETIHTGAKRVVDMIGSSTNVRFSLYADHAIGAQDIVAERSIAVYKQGTYYNIVNEDNNYNITGEAIPYVGKKTYPMFYVGQGGIYINAEDIYFSENTCIDFADWRYYDNNRIRAWEMTSSDGANSSPRLIFGWGIINSGSLHSANQTYGTCDNDISPEPFNITGADSMPSAVTMADGTFAIRHHGVQTLYTSKKNIANRVTFYQGPADYENYDDKSFSSQLILRTPPPEKDGNRGYTFNGAMQCITDVQNVNTFTTNHLEFGLTAMWPTADFVMWRADDSKNPEYPNVENNHFQSSRAIEFGLRASGIFHSGLFVDGYLYDTKMSKEGHYWLGQPYDFAFMVKGNSQMIGDLNVSNVAVAENIAKRTKTDRGIGGIRYDNSILLGGGKATVSGPKWRKLTITKNGKTDIKYVYKNEAHTPDDQLNLTEDNNDLIDPTSTDSSKSSDTKTQAPIMLDLGDTFGTKRLVRFNLAKNVSIDEKGKLLLDPIKDTDPDDSAVLLGRWPGSGWQSNITNGNSDDLIWRELMTGKAVRTPSDVDSWNSWNSWDDMQHFNPTLVVAFWNDTSCHVEIHIKADFWMDEYAGLFIDHEVSNKDSKGCAKTVGGKFDTKIKLPKGCPLPICPQTYSVAGVRRAQDGSGGSNRDKYKHGDAGIQFSLGTDGTLRVDSCHYPYMLYGGDHFKAGYTNDTVKTNEEKNFKTKRLDLYKRLHQVTSFEDLKDQTDYWQELVLTFDYPVISTSTSEGNTGGSTGGSTGGNARSAYYYIFGTIDESYIQNGSIRNPNQNDTLQITIPNTISVGGQSYSTILSAVPGENESESEGDKLLNAIANDDFKSVHQYIVMAAVATEDKPSLQSLTFGVTSQTETDTQGVETTTYSWSSTANDHDNINFPILVQTIDTSDYIVMHPDPNRSTQTINGSLTVDKSLTVNGSQTVIGDLKAAAFYEDSDRRLKDNIEDIDKDTKQKLSNINFKQFDINGSHRYGVIAQDIEKQIPAVVSTDKQGYKSVDYISLLCAKISELQDRIEELEKERKKD